MSKERDINSGSKGNSSFWNNVKNLPNSNARKWAILIIILIPVLVITIPLGMLAITGSFSGIGKPLLGNNSIYHRGYGTIELREYANNSVGYNQLEGTVAFVNYTTDVMIDDNISVIGKSDIFQIYGGTLGYVYDIVNGTNLYQNRTFVVYGNGETTQTNPYQNVIYMNEKTESGDLQVFLEDLNGTAGSFNIGSLNIENRFNMTLNNTGNRYIGLQQYIPVPFQLIANISDALWLETDGNMTNCIIDGMNRLIDQDSGKSYIKLPVLNPAINKTLDIQMDFNIGELPTYFKFYDGIPLSYDLILTVS